MKNIKPYNLYIKYCLVLLSVVFASRATYALDTKYMRNGEAYLLIGEQNDSGHKNPFKGIFRLNNAEDSSTDSTYKNKGGVCYISDITNTIGFAVDLDRKIYPFSEDVGNWVFEKYMFRQVVDNVNYLRVDYGYHAYIHHDNRAFAKATDLYRSDSGRSNGNIYKHGGGSWSGFKSLGPGTYKGSFANVLKDPDGKGYQYAPGSGVTAIPTDIGGTKNWYKILNQRWYSCWVTKPTESKSQNGGLGYFYVCAGDKEQTKNHIYHVHTWSDPSIQNHQFTENTYKEVGVGEEVGRTREIKYDRRILAGCLDGCGGASGGGSAAAQSASATVAFQPKPNGATTGDRAYFYTRIVTSKDYSLLYNGTEYPKGSIIGDPSDLSTYWIGVSLAGVNSDYVYALGTKVIRGWYKESNSGKDQSNMEIKATAVSNQWSQEGGIVFAYDKKNSTIYKFVRDDKTAHGIKDYRAYDCGNLASLIGSSNSELDDLAADGFGSMYFALSYPSKTTSGYNPPAHFKDYDAQHVHYGETTKEGYVTFDVLFKQEYSKAVYKMDYMSEAISEVGKRPFAIKVYSVSCCVRPNVWNQIKDLPYPNKIWYDIIKTDYQKAPDSNIHVGGYAPTASNLNKKMFNFGVGTYCDCAYWRTIGSLDEENPGHTQLAVINIPTPPEVRHIGPYKVSYLDICGPYKSLPLPPYPNDERTTNQHKADHNYNNLPAKTPNYYMVENYPLDDRVGLNAAQDPKRQSDLDEDTRAGGFISSILNTKSGEEGGDVKYEWKLWLVEDAKKRPCCELFSEEANGSRSYCVWYYAGSKFILTCRVYYKWYDYDRLPFGSTYDDVPHGTNNKDPYGVVQHSFAWPSRTGFVVDGAGKPPADSSSCYTMLDARDRLTEIMNTHSEFAFMKPTNKPTDVEGAVINYADTILSDGANSKYWAIEPLIIQGNATEPPPLTLTASIERCDHVYKTNGNPEPAPASYIYGDYWSGPETVGKTKCFTIETGKTFYWRMAIASQTKFFYDISKTTKVDPNRINDNDFNLVAYYLSAPKIQIGGKEVENPNYTNGDKNVQFYPNEKGSCWWSRKKNADGTEKNPQISIMAMLNYKLPDGTIKTVELQGDGYGKPVNIDLVPNETTLWQLNKPLIATMSSNLNIPPTDPLVGTLTVQMAREYYCKMHIINDEGTEMGTFKLGPMTLYMDAEASVRILDTESPRIVYNETSPNNLYGLTGRALAKTYEGESKSNPDKISFTIRDNNVWESSGESGVGLYDHVFNYMYNFGSEACEKYASGSATLYDYYKKAKAAMNTTDQKGIRKRIQDSMNQNPPAKTSNLNMKPLFSRAARDTRFLFDTASRKKDGDMGFDKADRFKYDGPSQTYLKDDNLFDGDTSNYAYNPGISGSSYLSAPVLSTVDDGANVYHSTAKYGINLTNIRLSNGENMVPDGYANNTPGYKPYQFYVRATDCSGNYTKQTSLQPYRREVYMPLNLALHVRDDIPPIPYGIVTEKKSQMSFNFPQQNRSGIVASSATTLDYKITNLGIYPTYFGLDLDKDFFRQTTWYSGDDNEYGYFNGDKSHTYSALLSFAKGNTTSESGLSIVYGDTVKNKANLKKQLQKGIAPYYVEDNVECLFNVGTSDNAGSSIATLTFKYYPNFAQTIGGTGAPTAATAYAIGGFVSSGTLRVKDVPDYNKTLTSTTAVGMFRAPNTMYPLAIPIMIVSQDNAMDFDEYTSYNVSEPDPNKPCGDCAPGNLKQGKEKPNIRRILTSLIVLNSGLDVRLLDKTLQNK